MKEHLKTGAVMFLAVLAGLAVHQMYVAKMIAPKKA